MKKVKAFWKTPAIAAALGLTFGMAAVSCLVVDDPLPGPITNATIIIPTPFAGAVPVSAISGSGFTGTVSWLPNDATFQVGTQYTATVTLTANEPRVFGGGLTAAVNGQTVTVATATATTATLAHAFANVPPLFDFQAFLANLPLGNIAGGGAWPVWSTGNTLSVVVDESSGERALSVSFGGAHGVDIRLAGANSVLAVLGRRLEFSGRIFVIATGEAPATSSFPNMWPFQLAAIRSAGGQDPSANLTSVPIMPPSPEFVVSRVITAGDLATSATPTLRLVNEPSNPATVMYVTDIRVLPY